MNINIVLINPEIPQNTGNIMRTCAATNINLHLIKPLGFKLDEKNVRRSAANYINDVNMIVHENVEDFFKDCKGEYYFMTRYGKKAPSEFNFKESKKDIYIILGSESSGIDKEILKNNIDNCMRLPMTDKVRSLNLSNVAAILAYEVLRQFDYNSLELEEPETLKGKDFLIK